MMRSLSPAVRALGGPSLWVLLLAACAPPLAGPSPAEIPALEARLASDSLDLDLLLRAGAAYREAGRVEDARTVLSRAHRTSPESSSALLLLGLTQEDLGEYGLARELYERYVDQGRSAKLKREIEQRLHLLRRKELQASVREALAREAGIASTLPEPNTVAVFPFLLDGGDPELRPLGRALADMVTTDLSQTSRLRVLERVHVQLLLDEMKLSDEGVLDPATAARSGRLLGAERIVQGSLGGAEDALELQAGVVRIGRDLLREQDAHVRESDRLERLFELQKRLSFRLYAAMGVELTEAEREKVSQRPTQNVRALLAYGRGLEALDGGDYAGAQRGFGEALSLDPGFSRARERLVSSQAAEAAARAGTRGIARQAAAEAAPPATEASVEGLVPAVGQRDAAAEVLGTEGIDRVRKATLRVRIRTP